MPKRRCVLLVALFSLAACTQRGAGGATAPAISIDLVADRATATYAAGETVTFHVEVKQGGERVREGTLAWTTTLEGVRPIERGQMALVDGAADIRGTLNGPGILRCAVELIGSQPVARGLGGAVFEPEKIAPSAAEPDDFDAFWTAQKALLAEIPIDAQLTERPEHSTPRVQVYLLTLANLDGSRVWGWLGVPRAPGPKPAVLTVPWAGVYATPLGLVGWAERGFLALAISAHDAAIDQPEAFYAQLNDGRLRGYPHQGRESRDTYYFRRVFLGCVRAVDYLTGRDDWDGQSMIVNGSSQGGALSLVCAGLDPRVTALAANVPAMCDHRGREAGRQPGWPGLVPDGDAAVATTSGYYDAVTFARRIRCPAIVGVGLIDTVCPPSGVFAAYNQLRGPKQIEVTPRMGHAQSDQYSALLNRWIPEQAGLAP